MKHSIASNKPKLKSKSQPRKLRIGVLGAGRGKTLAVSAAANGMEVVALCDQNVKFVEARARELGESCLAFSDYSKMLDTDLDAIAVANYATDHVWAVKQALAAGKHVLSECMACFTLAEAVELIEAVEKSGKIYMFAENYPFFAQNIEMKRLFESGKYGKFIYGEGEYVHPMSARTLANYCSGSDHWRTWLPGTYYCTHSMGPIMNITGTRPVAVSGFMLPYDYDDPETVNSLRTSDGGSVIICKMDNEAIVKILPWTSLRDHGQRYRICCNRGTLEWNQGDGRLRVRTDAMDFPRAKKHFDYYQPKFPKHLAPAAGHGHGGADYITSYYFKKAIETGIIEPRLDVYSAVEMTLIGIQAYRSANEGNRLVEIPDLRTKKNRSKYRDDHWNPDPAKPCPNKPSSSIRGKIKVTPAATTLFRKNKGL